MLHVHINVCIAAGRLEDVHTEQRMPPAVQLAYLTILALEPPAELAQQAAAARKDAVEHQAREAEKQAGEEEKERRRLLYKVVQGLVTLLSLGAVWFAARRIWMAATQAAFPGGEIPLQVQLGGLSAAVSFLIACVHQIVATIAAWAEYKLV
jgi:hypothetical protein